MAPSPLHLPDGQTFTVSPVFGGMAFKSHELTTHHNAFPIGWTVVLQTSTPPFKTPTLNNDSLFISSISNPSNTEFKPAASPTRQIAMMMWVTLYWYFHLPAPLSTITSEASNQTPEEGRPRGDWEIGIKQDGVLRGRNLIPKLERMGLIASRDTAVGTSENESEGWDMFVSRRMFWLTPGRLFLFTLQPTRAMSSFPGSPVGSRPNSPSRSDRRSLQPSPIPHDGPQPGELSSVPSFPIGPFSSTSHLPTYFPPAAAQYILTNNVRHPLRPKPPRMGEVFYSRFVPSVGSYLSFRVASSSPKPVPYLGPLGPTLSRNAHLATLSDTSLVQMWLSVPRVSAFWGGYTPYLLENALRSPHSFPVIGMWDGVPFGYFEIYWVKEDLLGRHLDHEAGDWDRGLHVLVGEEWARGRVSAWLGGLVHWAFCADFRTGSVVLEPRVDNKRFIDRAEEGGFMRERQVALPHKQAWFMRLRRDVWEGPSL